MLELLRAHERDAPVDGDVWARGLLAWQGDYTGRPDAMLKAFGENCAAGALYPEVSRVTLEHVCLLVYACLVSSERRDATCRLAHEDQNAPPHPVHSSAPTLPRAVDSPSLAHRENNRRIPAFPCLLSHARHQTGADDTEAQSFGKVAPCLLRFGGAASAAPAGGDAADAAAPPADLFLTNLATCVRAHQNNELNVSVALFWGKLLRAVTTAPRDSDVAEALATVKAGGLGATTPEAAETLGAAIERVEARFFSCFLFRSFVHAEVVAPPVAIAERE